LFKLASHQNDLVAAMIADLGRGRQQRSLRRAEEAGFTRENVDPRKASANKAYDRVRARNGLRFPELVADLDA
jgi:hypothetical protein